MILAPDPVSENIYFDLYFTTNYWDRPPMVNISVDDSFIGTYTLDQPEHHIRFRRSMGFHQPHTLQIYRHNKDNSQTKFLPDGTLLTQMVQINQVKIDNIDLRNIVWHKSTFEPQYPEPWFSEQVALGQTPEKIVPGEMYLGHNGTWRFNFTSPIYRFLVNWVRGIE